MTTKLYNSSVNPISGETFKSLSVENNVYSTEWTVLPNGHAPFEHIHVNQDETFLVKSGELRVVINGVEHLATVGESITVPKGVKHIAFNNSTSETLSCILNYEPALDHVVFMQCFNGLTTDGFLDKNGGIDIPKMGYFMVKMKAKCVARPSNIPAPIFAIALRFFYLRGVLSGWGKLFRKYTT